MAHRRRAPLASARPPSSSITEPSRRPTAGFVLALAAALFWGAGSIAVQALAERGWSSLDLVRLITYGSLAVLALADGVRGLIARQPAEGKTGQAAPSEQTRTSGGRSWRDIGLLLLVGLVGKLATDLALTEALVRLGAALGITLFYLNPVVVALVLTARHRHARYVWPAVLTLAGAALATGALNPGGLPADLDSLGVLAGVLAAVAYTAYTLGSDSLMATWSPWQVIVRAQWVSAAGLTILRPPGPEFWTRFDALGLLLALGLGVGLTVIPFSGMLWAIRWAGPGAVAVALTAELPITMALSVAVLAEPIAFVRWAGALVMVGGITWARLRM